jgi:hypothetical protein
MWWLSGARVLPRLPAVRRPKTPLPRKRSGSVPPRPDPEDLPLGSATAMAPIVIADSPSKSGRSLVLRPEESPRRTPRGVSGRAAAAMSIASLHLGSDVPERIAAAATPSHRDAPRVPLQPLRPGIGDAASGTSRAARSSRTLGLRGLRAGSGQERCREESGSRGGEPGDCFHVGNLLRPMLAPGGAARMSSGRSSVV